MNMNNIVLIVLILLMLTYAIYEELIVNLLNGKTKLKIKLRRKKALLNKLKFVPTVPLTKIDCYAIRMLFGIPSSVILLSALTIRPLLHLPVHHSYADLDDRPEAF